MNSRVRTRMAPSPTGEYHVGHIATLLKNYAWAKKNGGQFILRIEDTDRERLVPGAVDKILSTIRAYGLDWDEGPDKGGPYAPYVQSQRLPLYQQKAHQLIDQGQAYYCFCSKARLEQVRAAQQLTHLPPKYDRHCRALLPSTTQARVDGGESAVIRLKVPDHQPVIFQDWIRGQIEVNSDEVDDQVLLKSDGFPTYHLGVVVDDYLMKITHVLRGEEWISSTPKHILLYQAFGWLPPIYAHLPIFLNSDGRGKMSKRRGTVSAQSFLDQGYLPEAMLNFFMILGWATTDQREILSLSEYIQEFDPRRISAKSVVFDLAKLAWINGVYIRRLSMDQLIARAEPFLPADFPKLKMAKIFELIRERLTRLGEIEALTDFFYRPITVDLQTQRSSIAPELRLHQLRTTQQLLTRLPTDAWQSDTLEMTVRQCQTERAWSKSQYFMLIRLVMTGKLATPPLFETIAVMGRNLSLTRLQSAIDQIHQE